jgi:hypothetical protein
MNQEQAQIIFRKACDSLVEILRKEGLEKEKQANREKITEALRRALALYLREEKYENCSLIHKSVKKSFGVELTPDFASLEKIGI